MPEFLETYKLELALLVSTLVLAVLIGLVVRRPSGQPGVSDCAEFPAKLPADWLRGYLTVPENPAEPGGLQIQVFYYGKITEGSVPTVFFNGGPGYSSHVLFESIAAARERFDSARDLSLVFIDQRGTGCSAPYPAGEKHDLEILKRQALYGATEIVADAEAVRRHLIGTRPWNVFGQSYGGYIAYRYLLLAPASIKSLFIHGEAILTDEESILKNRVFSQTRILSQYYKRHPEDRERLMRLQAHFQKGACYNGPGAPQICGMEALSDLTEMLGYESQWQTLHAWIEHMSEADSISETGIQNYLSDIVFRQAPQKESRYSQPSLVVNWIDRNGLSADFENCKKIEASLKKKGVLLSEYPLNQCAASLQHPEAPVYEPEDEKTLSLIYSLPRKPVQLHDIRNRLLTHPTLNFYLYAGRLDTFVPEENFLEQSQFLQGVPGFKYRLFETSGHDGFLTEPDFWQDLIAQSKPE